MPFRYHLDAFAVSIGRPYPAIMKMVAIRYFRWASRRPILTREVAAVRRRKGERAYDSRKHARARH
jgi:hypothetical protein